MLRPAGYLLTGMRRHRRRAHSPMVLAHTLSTDFFGIEELAAYWPDFETFMTWPATARILWDLRDLDRLAGQSSLDHFGHWLDPISKRIVICSRAEMKRVKYLKKQIFPDSKLLAAI
jgi:hypothetical protein